MKIVFNYTFKLEMISLASQLSPFLSLFYNIQIFWEPLCREIAVQSACLLAAVGVKFA